ncbi:MAG: LicD family protein, partial [Eubacteriales bacterium]
KNLVLPDMVAALAVGGVGVADIPAALPGIIIDEQQTEWILQNAINANKCIADVDIDYINPALLEFEDFEGYSPGALNVQNALKSFSLENMSYLNYKRHKLVKQAIKIQAGYNKPLSEMGLLGKIFALPFKMRTQLKILIHFRGKKRLVKRKVTEVDPADTRKIQFLVFQIMLEFEKICKKHNLRYYIAGGSILGGIRHKGFIPWDDDIDITMPRPDYEKLLKIAPKELPEEYILEKDCVPYCHNRIEIKGTTFNSGLRNGRIFLDILALEGSPEDMGKRLQHEAKCKYWRSFMLEKARPIPAMAFNKKSTRLFFKRLFLRLTPRRFLKWRWHSWAAKYSTEETDSWVCLPASIYTYEQERFPKGYWGEPVYMEFEGHMLPTMAHWEDYLVCHFGDYMKMPPETTRKSHHYVFEYNLGKYANISTEELEKSLLGK